MAGDGRRVKIVNVSLLAKLDFIFAKSKLSLNYKCTCPKINSEGKIVIKKGRHPLLDVKTVVPIDFWIGEDFDTLVITGPNTGGKTVTLKTVRTFYPYDAGRASCSGK